MAVATAAIWKAQIQRSRAGFSQASVDARADVLVPDDLTYCYIRIAVGGMANVSRQKQKWKAMRNPKQVCNMREERRLRAEASAAPGDGTTLCV